MFETETKDPIRTHLRRGADKSLARLLPDIVGRNR